MTSKRIKKQLERKDNITFVQVVLEKEKIRSNTIKKQKISEVQQILQGIKGRREKLERFSTNTQKTKITDSKAIRQLDEIYNAVFKTILTFLGKNQNDFPWDMYYIGNLADLIYDEMIVLGLSPGYPYCEASEGEEETWYIDAVKETDSGQNGN